MGERGRRRTLCAANQLRTKRGPGSHQRKRPTPRARAGRLWDGVPVCRPRGVGRIATVRGTRTCRRAFDGI